MKFKFKLATIVMLSIGSFLQSVNSQSIIDNLRAKKITLPNGWSLTPAGKTIPLFHDLPLNMVFSPNKKRLAITNNGCA